MFIMVINRRLPAVRFIRRNILAGMPSPAFGIGDRIIIRVIPDRSGPMKRACISGIGRGRGDPKRVLLNFGTLVHDSSVNDGHQNFGLENLGRGDFQ